MNDIKRTVLCVDDEQNILNSLKRLLRKEGYRLLTASSGSEGLALLAENEVHLVMSDQRMPGMNGTEFLARVKESYPEIIRIILTGYTEVDAITESINRGHIYKFFLKPWNDENLKLEIQKALEQYDLIQANKELSQTILKQNEELKKINENLEDKVAERTRVLKIQNQALELSRAILEDIPYPIIGVSAEGSIVLINNAAQEISINQTGIVLGENVSSYFNAEFCKSADLALKEQKPQRFRNYNITGKSYDIQISPLSGRFSGKGTVMILIHPDD